MQTKTPIVYIMANKNRTIYTGVTTDLYTRVWQHKYQEHPKAFTAQYACNQLVYYTEFSRVDDAIAFEKYVKGKSRAYKIALIEEMNPRWNDLAWDWYK